MAKFNVQQHKIHLDDQIELLAKQLNASHRVTDVDLLEQLIAVSMILNTMLEHTHGSPAFSYAFKGLEFAYGHVLRAQTGINPTEPELTDDGLDDVLDANEKVGVVNVGRSHREQK